LHNDQNYAILSSDLDKRGQLDIYTAYTDGGARVSNPGEAAWGFVVYKNDIEIHRDGAYMGIASNNAAEYEAVLRLLTWWASQPIKQPLKIHSDSQLIVNQIRGDWKVLNDDLRPKRNSAATMLLLTLSDIVWVPRAMNTEADSIVNQVLDKELKGRNK
jgi:ribonuclease HI